MKMELYCPVRSLAGHDKNQYFIIVSDEGEYITMANGTTRKVDDPKRKNKKHIQAGKTPLLRRFPLMKKSEASLKPGWKATVICRRN